MNRPDECEIIHGPVVLPVISFTYEQHEPLSLVMLDGEPWFAAADLCRAFGENLGTALFTVDRDDKLKLPLNLLHAGKTALHTNDDAVYFFNEPALYELAMRSGSKRARAFKRWITHEVLPTVHRAAIPGVTRDDLALRVRKVTVARKASRGDDSPHALYRFRDRAGVLLYVGISWRLDARMHAHRGTKKWWHEVDSVSVEHFPDRATADAAETTAIQTERPRYNIRKVIAHGQATA